MIKRQQYWPLRYQQIGMYDVWGYDVVYSGKFIDEYEYKNNPWIQHGLHSIQDCFLSKGSYAYTSSVMLFFMKWNLCREVPLCLSKQNVWTHKLRKVYDFKKIVIRNKLLDLIAFVYKVQDKSFMTYHQSYKQIGHLMGHATVCCNLNSNMLVGVGCSILAAR